MGQQRDPNSPDVVIGEDWEKDVELSNELKDSRLRRGMWAFRKSPLTRKIVTFNLIALNILIIGVLFLNSSRENLVQQRARAMLNEAELVGNVVSVLHAGGQDLIQSPMLSAAMTDLPLRKGEQVYIVDPNRAVVTSMVGRADIVADGLSSHSPPFTPITNTLEVAWSTVIELADVTNSSKAGASAIDVITASIDAVLSGQSRIEEFSPSVGQNEFLAMAPIRRDGALGKVFNRFYSERPANDFGNNSGLGLATSKQIVEAHDGAIWAEDIRPTQMDATSAPLGARFVVGLPL